MVRGVVPITVSMTRTTVTAVLVTLIIAVCPTPAAADATFFFGYAPKPSGRPVRGFALGATMAVVGFEFEYSNTDESQIPTAPGLKTYHVQRPARLADGLSGVRHRRRRSLYRDRAGFIAGRPSGRTSGAGSSSSSRGRSGSASTTGSSRSAASPSKNPRSGSTPAQTLRSKTCIGY